MKRQLTTLLLATVALSAAAQTIQPTPHSLKKNEGVIALKQGAKIIGVDQADPIAVKLLETIVTANKKGITIKIGEQNDKIFSKIKAELPNISGAYYLKSDPKEGIIIIGADERGTYYGVQTLKQLIAQDGTIPAVEIKDYPDILFRGSVEGFYGKPWSHRDRLAQLKFYGENKLNTYIYGPKDDPYHSSLSNHSDSYNKDSKGGWRVPYPEAEAQNIRELAETAKQYKVDFVWAIHPGQDIKWNDEDYNNLLNKFEHMYDLGVRSYAVFFDDISGEGTNPVKQAELLNRINKEFVQVKGDVTPLILCPTEYNKSWANPKPDGYLNILGDKLDPSIQIMWTGDRVCADITMETLDWINPRIKRPTYIWWNFPVTDYVRHKVLQGPSYGLDTKATSKDMAGFVSNPMENAEASKVALYGVADYAWNIAAYDYMNTWERAIKNIMPQAADAYRTFAIHSADLEQNGHGYRRDESWETKAIDPMNYTAADYKALYDEFSKLAAAPAKMLASGADEYLLAELKPWLVQSEALGKRGIEAMELIRTYENGSAADVWGAYLKGTMSDHALQAYNKNKPGTLVLQPFIDNTRDAVGEKLYEKLSGEPIKKQIPMSSFVRQETLPQMMDGNDKTFFYSWAIQKAGDWVGVDLGEIQSVTNVLVEQGRKDKDKDYFQHAILEYSTDNATWKPLTQVLDSAYTIRYNSAPVEARYVRLRAAEGCSQKNWTAIRRFDVNPMQSTPIVMTNTAQVTSANINTEGRKISIQPMLEIIKVEPQGYFGIELPLIASIESVAVDLNLKNATVEYSADGQQWSDKATQARYIRFVNKSNKAVDVNLRKFEVVTAAQTQGNLMNALDKKYATTYQVSSKVELVRPVSVSKVTLMASASSKGSVVALNAQGKESSLGNCNGGLVTFNLPADAVAIVLDGNILLHEVVWGK